MGGGLGVGGWGPGSGGGLGWGAHRASWGAGGGLGAGGGGWREKGEERENYRRPEVGCRRPSAATERSPAPEKTWGGKNPMRLGVW
ncbi:hypothetical protein TIFTF001_052402 [Ficus carica]|uniref:Uncharacterized protein n=1 Tax=Ficus carica TaxID=3494 RepID=A0AA88EGI9_FICCA|nr:hypothetical protein TIFTF001_052402 [Ficus carica]